MQELFVAMVLFAITIVGLVFMVFQKKGTVGEGYNDLLETLSASFELVEHPCKLSHYAGYSDASFQYEIKDLNLNDNKKRI